MEDPIFDNVFDTKPNSLISFHQPSIASPINSLISFHQPSIASQLQFHNYNQLSFDIKPLDLVVVEKTGFRPLVSQGSYEEEFEKEEEEEKIFSIDDHDKPKNQVSRNTIQAQEHVIAERNRREKLSRSFIALSAIVPGLTKMDKASVLGEAIKYMKELQERVQALGEDAATKKVNTLISTVLVKGSIFFDDDDGGDNNCNCNNKSFPEIQVRVCGKDVLIKIQSDKQSRRVATDVLDELENHNLTVHSSTL